MRARAASTTRLNGAPALPCRAWLLAVLAALVLSATARAQTVWEVTPYRVQILVGFAAAPELTPRLRADLCRSLAERIDAVVGAPWDAQIAPAPHDVQLALAVGIEFAFPTTTTYLAHDDRRPLNIQISNKDAPSTQT